MILQALAIGILLGVLEFLILYGSKQKIGFWVYAQSIVFWITCGFMIGVVNSPLPPYVTGAMIAFFLSLPWYINVSIIPGQYGHLMPLVVASIVLGMVGGFARMLMSTMF